MSSFTIVDWIVAAIIILSAVLAYGRGFLREGMAIAGWIGAAIAAYVFAPEIEPLVREIPVLGGFIGNNCDLSMLGAFFIILLVALIILSFFTPFLSSLLRRPMLEGADRILGLFFGALRGVLLIAIAFFLYDTVITGQEFSIIDDSYSAGIFADLTGQIQQDDARGALDWLRDHYIGLIQACGSAA